MDSKNQLIIDRFQVEVTDRMPLVIRGYNRRDHFPALLRDLGYRDGCEVGVEQGHYSETLLKAIPDLHLSCVDPWQAYDRYIDHRDQAKLDRYYQEAILRLSFYRDRAGIIRLSSMDAVKQFAPNSLDFVYIDGNHMFEYVVNDLIEWYKIVRPGGIIAGHDYRRDKADRIPFHVIQAVSGYTDAYKINPWFVLKDGTSPSWFWVKP